MTASSTPHAHSRARGTSSASPHVTSVTPTTSRNHEGNPQSANMRDQPDDGRNFDAPASVNSTANKRTTIQTATRFRLMPRNVAARRRERYSQSPQSASRASHGVFPLQFAPMSTVTRFGEFEFSRSAQRLTRNGKALRLTGQPLHLLVLLLEDPGRLVTREEIRTRLWPNTTVDFDHSLDVALNRLRAVLDDNAKEPAFIETVPRLGYRFVAVVATPPGARPERRGRSIAARVGLYALTAILAALVALAIVHQH